jgi:hypothetical protein
MATKNYEALKAVMDHFDVDSILPDKLNDFFPWYKESLSIRKNLPQLFRPPFIIMDWINFSFELKIKNELLSHIQREKKKVEKIKYLILNKL